MNIINKSDKVFVAGASGMVGSAVVRKLKEEEFQNILVPKRDEVDLEDFKEVKIWFELNKPDIVIFCAAKVGGILANSTKPAEFIMQNLKIQNNVIENSFKNGTKRFLFLGSSCIYPKNVKKPIKEESLLSGNLEETNEWYAIAKIAGIKLCEALRKQHNFDAISLMPTNLYGPGDNYHPQESHVMASLISKFCISKKKDSKYVECWGTGKPLREFLHVDDLGDAAVFCLENWDPNSRSAPRDDMGLALNHLNVGTGKDITIKELANKISLLTDFKGDIVWDQTKPDGTPKKQLDITKITNLGWKPKIDIDSGIKNTIKNYLNNL